jgi:glycosyltransferase involved in cell wall biosynthesis
MTPAPLVSVIIPARNAEAFLGDAVQSVLRQDYSPLEIVIVVHNSGDATGPVAARLSAGDGRIRVFTLDRPGGAAVSRNFGVREARGEYVAFLDADDRWLDDKLAIQMRAYGRRPEASFAYSASVTVGDVGWFSPLFEVLPLPWRAARSHAELLAGNPVTCSSVLTRKALVDAAGGFDEHPDNAAEDYDLWLKLSQAGPPLFVPRILVEYRIHAGQFSGRGGARFDRLEYVGRKWNLALRSRPAARRNPLLRIVRNAAHLLSAWAYKSKLLRSA